MTIISKRHLDIYRPNDIIPAEFFTDESLAYAIAKGRVQVTDDEPATIPPRDTPPQPPSDGEVVKPPRRTKKGK